MQEYEVKVTEYVEDALRGIGQYILKELQAPQAAVNTLQAIRKEIKSLNKMPTRVHLTPEVPWRSYGVRRLRVKNYYVYFWIDEDEFRVQVTHVVYVGRNQKNQLEIMPLE